ncbi:hypothetical protein Leryth_010768 [Lithospermum erythrorhizon]|nr:hypothetical protein Leryth_010768 [Lithospermum erythrorhizon]
MMSKRIFGFAESFKIRVKAWLICHECISCNAFTLKQVMLEACFVKKLNLWIKHKARIVHSRDTRSIVFIRMAASTFTLLSAGRPCLRQRQFMHATYTFQYILNFSQNGLGIRSTQHPTLEAKETDLESFADIF